MDDNKLPTRRDRWSGHRRAATAAVAVAVVVGAVGFGPRVLGERTPPPPEDPPRSDTAVADPSSSGRATEPVYEYSNRPSPVVLRLADRDVVLQPWTYCWSGPEDSDGISTGTCADGAPQEVAHLDDIGDPRVVRFWFGVEDWDFTATFRQLGTTRGHEVTVDAVATGDHTFRLGPAGRGGRYQVDLFGQGEGGDISTSFVWTLSPGRAATGRLAR